MTLWPLPTPSGLAVRALAALAVASAGFLAGWGINGWRLGAEVATVKATAAQAQAKAVGAALDQLKAATADRDAKAVALAAIDAAGSETLRRFQRENESLRGAVAAGSRVVRVRGAECPAATADLSGTPARGGVDTGGGTILGPQAGTDVLDFRADAQRVAAKLDACQSALGCLTGQRACQLSPR